MKNFAFTTLVTLLAGTSAAFAIEPIQGSITYGDRPAHLEKSPAGSTFDHVFTTHNGDQAIETYRVQADKSLILVDRAFSQSN